MYGLHPDEERAQEEHAKSVPYVTERDSPIGFFENSGAASLQGLGAAAISANNLLNEGLQPVADAFTRPLDAVFGTDTTGDYARIVEGGKSLMRDLRPDPATTGFFGQMAYGVGSVLPQAAIGFFGGGPAGAAALVGAAQGNEAKDRAVDQGVDPATAIGVGAIEGVSQAAGILLPGGIGGTVWKKIASGAGMNVALGATQRGGTGAYLRERGYSDMADQYRVLDGAALAADVVLGGAFGAMHQHAKAKGKAFEGDPLPSDIDAALAGLDLHILELDTSPGIPADAATRNAHVDAMTRATQQLLNGEPVHVADVMTADDFVPRPHDAALEQDVRAAMDENGLSALEQEPPRSMTILRGIDPNTLIFREEVQDRIEEVKGRFPEGDGYNPIVATNTEDGLLILDGHNRSRVAIERGDKIDVVVIPEYIYKKAIKDGWDEVDISHAALEYADASDAASDIRRQFPGVDFIKSKHVISSMFDEHSFIPDHSGPAVQTDTAPRLARTPDQDSVSPVSPVSPVSTVGGDASTAQADPRLTTAQSVAQKRPDMTIAREMGDDAVKTQTAKEAMDEAESAVAQAKKDGALFDVAINCFLGSRS